MVKQILAVDVKGQVQHQIYACKAKHMNIIVVCGHFKYSVRGYPGRASNFGATEETSLHVVVHLLTLSCVYLLRSRWFIRGVVGSIYY